MSQASFLLCFPLYSCILGFSVAVRVVASFPSVSQGLHCHETLHTVSTSWPRNFEGNFSSSITSFLSGQLPLGKVNTFRLPVRLSIQEKKHRKQVFISIFLVFFQTCAFLGQASRGQDSGRSSGRQHCPGSSDAMRILCEQHGQDTGCFLNLYLIRQVQGST